MTDPVNQVQATYNPLEDRILFTIEKQNKQVFLGWVTRRFLTILLPALHGQHPTTGVEFFANSLPKVPTISHSKTVLIRNEQPDNTAKLQTYPLGEAPLLLSKITFKALHTEKAMLILSPEHGQGIELPFNPELLNRLLQTFKHPLETSSWSLEVNSIYGLPPNSRLQ